MDRFINAIQYEKKMVRRHLREMEERMDYTARNHPNVELGSFVFMIMTYRERLDTLSMAVRLYCKHVLLAPAEEIIEQEEMAQ
jgi:hypothetical protein